MEKRSVRPRVSEDTIYALSSGRVPAAIAVVRISGPKARVGLETIAGTIPEPRRAKRATFREPASGDIIDDGLVLWFPAPGSETGEDLAELHLHGGRAILAAVFQVLGGIGGFRPAQAGEFTRRALANNKLDLTAVEGLGDLIAAETAAQRRQAMAQYRGALAHQVDAWRTQLIEAMALVEAAIDFSDEGDVPQNLLAPAAEIARELGDEIKGTLADSRRGERLRDGFVVAIAGAPNVGKSTLLNRLAEREAAIVSATPGTTRDTIEVALDLGGVPVVLVDTAGVRDTTDPVEAEGVRRALARAESADLALWLLDASRTLPGRAITGGRVLEVWTKIDLLDSEAQRALTAQGSIRLSANTGAGMDELIALLAREASALGGEPALVTHERQRHALKEAVERIEGALRIVAPGQEELFAEELRLAARALGRVTGTVGVEEVLEAVFRNFCVGK
jgi:tRNA modification GTPase